MKPAISKLALQARLATLTACPPAPKIINLRAIVHISGVEVVSLINPIILFKSSNESAG